MVKLGKDSVGVVRFELGVKILFLVHIDEAHTSTSVVVVKVFVLNGNMVFSFLEFRDIQENESFRVVGGCLMSIDHDFLDVLALKVDWQLGGNGCKGEGEFRKSVVVSSFLENDVKVVGDGSLFDDIVSGLCSLLG